MQIAVGNSIITCKMSGAPVESAKLAVVFLHGWGRDMSDFDDMEKRLRPILPNAAFVGLDLPGFGRSPLNREGGFSLDDYANTLKNFLDKLAVSRVILIGHSFGGRVSIRFSADHPEKVEKLILISTAGIKRKSFRLQLLAVGRRLFQTIFSSLGDFRFILRLKNLAGALLGSRDYRVTHGALRETFKKVIGDDLWRDAARLRVPALLIWGQNDKITPLAEGRTYHKLIPNSRLEILDCGHFPFLEKPDETAKLITSFLAEHA